MVLVCVFSVLSLCIAKVLVLSIALGSGYFRDMETVHGHEILKALDNISKAGGRFTIAFFKYSRAKKKASPLLRTIEGCKVRPQLPHERFEVDGDNYFLFEDADGNPKTAYKVLIRFVGLPADNYKLTKINWFNESGIS